MTQEVDSPVTIEIATDATQELFEAWGRLLPQLSSTASSLTPEQLEDICASDSVTMFLARHEGVIVGSLSLVTFRIPDGVRSWIESVVVDEGMRGKGIGMMLNRAAIAKATEQGTRSIDLTSRPSRVAANRLYRRLGFVQRETNVYRYQGTDS